MIKLSSLRYVERYPFLAPPPPKRGGVIANFEQITFMVIFVWLRQSLLLFLCQAVFLESFFCYTTLSLCLAFEFHILLFLRSTDLLIVLVLHKLL
jgi:hypothetical protein